MFLPASHLRPEHIVDPRKLDYPCQPGHERADCREIRALGLVGGRVLLRFSNPADELGVTYLYAATHPN